MRTTERKPRHAAVTQPAVRGDLVHCSGCTRSANLWWMSTVRLTLFTDPHLYGGESESLRGGLGQFEAKYLMPLALANAGRLGKYGA